MTRPMSAGLMSRSASASATVRLTTRQSSRTSWGPPTPVSTSTAPPGWVTTKPCTGHREPSRPCNVASSSRLISRAIEHSLVRRRAPAYHKYHGSHDQHTPEDHHRSEEHTSEL